MASQSLWQQRGPSVGYEALAGDTSAGALVVGGGLVGVLTAYLLKEAGLEVLLIEANRVGSGSSGKNTGKLTLQHGTIYSTLLKRKGEGAAADYHRANRAGVELIAGLAKSLAIPCDLEEVETALFTSTAAGEEVLREEQQAYQLLGIPGRLVENLPLPLPIRLGLTCPGQFGYDPHAFVTGLCAHFVKAGGRVCEGTRAVALHRGEQVVVETQKGHRITCQNLIIATQTPFFDGGGLFFTRLEPHRSYLLAAPAPDDSLRGAYLTVDGHTPSVHYAAFCGRRMVLVGGEDHLTGEEAPEAYDNLQQLLTRLGGGVATVAWSAQDYLPPDGMPYIGPLTPGEEHIRLASGFSKWGNSWSGAAALLLRDGILGKPPARGETFAPGRLGAIANLSFAKNAAHVAGRYIGGKLEEGEILPPQEHGVGRVVTLDGRQYGAYRDRRGELFLLDITCPHLGCTLAFNPLEETWDCPCHGSRFDYTGRRLEGPAVTDLIPYGRGKNPLHPNILG